MSLLWLLIPGAQALTIGVDEFWFHHKRGLPLWERIGHPMDTASLVFCLSIPFWMPLDSTGLVVYALAAAFSCLLVTKDEFVHRQFCTAEESWLHAVLFVLHPLVLLEALVLWACMASHPVTQGLPLLESGAARSLLTGQVVGASVFMVYQIGYWGRRSS